MYSAEAYRRAASVGEAAALLREDARNAVIAGGLWLREGGGRFRTLIDLEGLGLESIARENGTVSVGSMVTLRQLEKSEQVRQAGLGVLRACVEPVVGVQFRNMATVGGSVMSRLGFSDLVTAMLALDPILRFYEAGEILLEDFVKNPVKRDILLSV